MTKCDDYMEQLLIDRLTDDGITTAAAQEAVRNERDWNSNGNEQIY